MGYLTAVCESNHRPCYMRLALTLWAALIKSPTNIRERKLKRMPLSNQLFAVVLGCLVGASAFAANVEPIKQLISIGDFAEAKRLIDAILADEPGDLQTRFVRGLLLTESGDVDGAIDVFAALARDYPELPEPHNNLAVLYAANGEYVKARDALLVAINTHPSYATAHENLGDIYAKMAGLAYDQALQLDRDNQTAKAKLAMMHDLVSTDGDAPATRVTQTTTASEAAGATQTASVAPSAETQIEPAVVAGPSVDPIVSAQVLKVTERWANAWSDQDVEAYLSIYGDDFRPSTNHTRQQWEALRQKRLTKPKFIRINVDNPSVETPEPQRAVVNFTQGYQSDTYGDRVRKQLVFEWQGGDWKIVREQTVE